MGLKPLFCVTSAVSAIVVLAAPLDAQVGGSPTGECNYRDGRGWVRCGDIRRPPSRPRPQPTPDPAEEERQRRVAEADRERAFAEDALRAKDWDTAILHFKKSLELSHNRLALDGLGHAQNEKGIAAYKQGQWEEALTYFRDALRNKPANHTIKRNIENARLQIAVAARERQDRLAAESMRSTVGDVVSSLTPRRSEPSAATVDLTFAGQAPDPVSKLQFRAADTAQPGATRAPTQPPAATARSSAALDQLRTANTQSGMAARIVTDELEHQTKATRQAQVPFDTDSTNRVAGNSSLVDAGSTQSQLRQVPDELARRPEFRRLMAQKNELEREYRELEGRLAAVRAATPSGVPEGQQAVEIANIRSDLTRIRSSIRVVDIGLDDLTVSFQEENSTPASEPKPASKQEAEPPPKP